MADPKITFVETGTSTTKTLTFPNLPRRFEGFLLGEQNMTITEYGKSVTVIHGAWHQFDVEFESLTPGDDPDFWSTLTAWYSHALRGGSFTFALDGDNTVADSFSTAKTAADNDCQITDATNLTTGDWVYIQHANNSAIFERQKILTVNYLTEEVTFENNLHNSYPIGSALRHEDYFDNAVLLTKRKPPLLEREAGRGANKWDLKFTFRTVL